VFGCARVLCSRSIEEEAIGPNVVRALELTSPVNRASIKEQVPLGLRTTFSNFAGVQDTAYSRRSGPENGNTSALSCKKRDRTTVRSRLLVYFLPTFGVKSRK
jgi:hypothetical protein